MTSKTKFPFAITFDCDPLAFDQSLELVTDTNFQHLWESIPLALLAIKRAEEISNRPISATFFIRNLSPASRGFTAPENWSEFNPLWERIVEAGHSLGLHPHINFPLAPQFSDQSELFQNLMENDFRQLIKFGVTTRITRIGGHAYTAQTSDILHSLCVNVDSSAIPGRKLGEFVGASDWRQYTNKTLKNWSYNLDGNPESNANEGITQIPMSTLQQISNPEFYRYIDFSFKSFHDHCFLTSRFLTQCDVGVSVTHPSTLLKNQYMKHKSLEFGIENWISKFEEFFDTCSKSNVDFHFANLSEF